MPLPLLLVDTLIEELDREGFSTRRLLERVPVDHLDWKPHAKSTSLGDLAWHLASIPGRIATLIRAKTFDVGSVAAPLRESSDFPAELDRNLSVARALLRSFDEAALLDPFTITHQGQTVLSMPAATAIRSIMFNHAYHHRGQLTVYLRMLDVPLPIIYGNSADERM